MKPDHFEAFTVIVLSHGQEYLLLRRSADKPFAPGLWTGIGGRVEPEEFQGLAAAALRELAEETGIVRPDLRDFVLRRVLLLTREQQLIMVLYYTGRLAQRLLPNCTEGTLSWLPADRFGELNIIPSTRLVLPLLIVDQQRDAAGTERVKLGVGHYLPDGSFDGIAWS